jgi:hypothetical protein
MKPSKHLSSWIITLSVMVAVSIVAFLFFGKVDPRDPVWGYLGIAAAAMMIVYAASTKLGTITRIGTVLGAAGILISGGGEVLGVGINSNLSFGLVLLAMCGALLVFAGYARRHRSN